MGNCNSCCKEDASAVPVEVTAWNCEPESEDEAKSSPLEGVASNPVPTIPTITIVPAPPVANDLSFSKLSRLNMDHLEVDKEILRGISLGASLQSGGRLWRKSPLDMTEEEQGKLWSRSAPVDHYDLFMSHTWLTPGRHKVVSLLFQSGWKFALFCWVACVLLADILIIVDVLPMPFRMEVDMFCYQGEVHFSFWPLLGGFLGTWIGLFLSPYVAGLGCCSPKMCFLDVVSIHQTDQELMERGIYGLGGFLQVSKELRVLWSAPYLSRLWCVFELAAYRSANPNGKISLKPLFVERGMLCLMLGTYFAAFLFWIGLVLNISQAYSFLEMFALTPVFVIIHFLRWNIREKFKLFSDLKDFDLEKAFCRTEFDRNFVHGAIVKWYGSKDAFMRYVRGPLREELMLQGATYVPFGYFMMLSSATFAASLNTVSAMIKAKAPFECILSEFLGSGLGFYVFWFLTCLKMNLWLTERYAMPRWKGNLLNWLQSFWLFAVFVAMYSVGFYISGRAYRTSLSSSILWTSISFLCCAMSFCVPRCVNGLKRALAGAL